MGSSENGPLVLFVCRHGAARSVLAAATLRMLARERGLAVRARAAGVEPQKHISTALLPLLPDHAEALRNDRPRRVTKADLDEASRTVTFDVEPEELPAAANNVQRWDGVANVKDDPHGVQLEIERRVAQLLDGIA